MALQVVDEQQGPTTKREYDVAKVPVGDELAGKVVDFLGRAPGTQVQLGTSAFAPLFGEQPDMESREQIAEALVTGVKVCHHQIYISLRIECMCSCTGCACREWPLFLLLLACTAGLLCRNIAGGCPEVVPFVMQALDMLTPVGRGQALLVNGMRQSGKTSLVLDAILGQYRSGVRCIYAAIGQR